MPSYEGLAGNLSCVLGELSETEGQAFGCPADGPTVLCCRPTPLREGLLEARNLPGETQTQHWALSV